MVVWLAVRRGGSSCSPRAAHSRALVTRDPGDLNHKSRPGTDPRPETRDARRVSLLVRVLGVEEALSVFQWRSLSCFPQASPSPRLSVSPSPPLARCCCRCRVSRPSIHLIHPYKHTAPSQTNDLAHSDGRGRRLPVDVDLQRLRCEYVASPAPLLRSPTDFLHRERARNGCLPDLAPANLPPRLTTLAISLSLTSTTLLQTCS